MQISIDLQKINKKSICINEYLTLLSIYYQGKNVPFDYSSRKPDYFTLKDKGLLDINGSSVTLTNEAVILIEGVGRDYSQLANSIRELFPKGSKAGKYPWKSTVKAIVDKLKKLDKAFGLSAHSDEEILIAVKKYVNRFTMADMDRGMQIASYFIEKDGDSSLMAWLSMEDDVVKTKTMEIKL